LALIVIEGDNGTGKDTIAQKFQDNGVFIPTYTAGAKEREKFAKGKTGIERINAFIEYNAFCGNLGIQYSTSLIIRYWISTVAAAYADGVFSLDEAIGKSIELYNKLPVPDFVFCLKCDYTDRVSRIKIRSVATQDTSDDTTSERNTKYQKILGKLENVVANWYTIDTTKNTPERIFQHLLDITNFSIAKEKT
jgi:thymidylate kinase